MTWVTLRDAADHFGVSFDTIKRLLAANPDLDYSIRNDTTHAGLVKLEQIEYLRATRRRKRA